MPYKHGVTGSSPVVPTTTWRGSSVGQNAGLSRRRSRVQVPSASPNRVLRTLYAQIAQSVEQWIENPRVAGSIPALGTIVVVFTTTNLRV